MEGMRIWSPEHFISRIQLNINEELTTEETHFAKDERKVVVGGCSFVF